MPKISDLLQDIDLMVTKYTNYSKLEEENIALKIKLEWCKHCFKRATEMLDVDDRDYINNMFLYYFKE